MDQPGKGALQVNAAPLQSHLLTGSMRSVPHVLRVSIMHEAVRLAHVFSSTPQ